MQPRHLCLVLAASLSACVSLEEGPPVDPLEGSVTLQDYFFYSCVNEYIKAHGIPRFDGSLGYAQEYSSASGPALLSVRAAAKAYALSIHAPDYSDSEHGSAAVLVACLKESRGNAVAGLLRGLSE